jgi:Transglycosylase SLT domain
LKPIYGWIASLTTLAIGIVIPAQTNAEQVFPTQILAPLVAERTDNSATSLLLAVYKFNERSTRVANLQRAIGTVRVDGHYGAITRREHIEKLQAMNLPLDRVPVIPSDPTGGYDIPNDPAKRCPQWEPLFRQEGLEPVEVFSYIAWRESNCRPEAQNATWKNGVMVYHLNKDKSYDTGLLQINSSWQTVTRTVCGDQADDNHMEGLKDPVCNVRVAKYIMDNSQGKLANWRVYKK